LSLIIGFLWLYIKVWGEDGWKSMREVGREGGKKRGSKDIEGSSRI
jgi:hypothetical protein